MPLFYSLCRRSCWHWHARCRFIAYARRTLQHRLLCALGALLGVGVYLHPSSLFIVLGALVYIAHLLYIRVLFRERRSYTGFAILLMLIICMPYVISSINLPQFSGVHRILSHYNEGLPRSIADALLSIFANGDADPRHICLGVRWLTPLAVC